MLTDAAPATLDTSKSRLVEVPLGLDLVFVDGRRRRHDYSDLPNQTFARSLARAHLSLVNTGGGIKAPQTSATYAGVVRNFIRWLADRGFGGTLGELDARLFTTYLRAPTRPFKGDAYIKVLIRACADLPGEEVAPAVLAHAQVSGRRRAEPIKASLPLKPLSPGENQRLEEACKNAIDSVEQQHAEALRCAQEELARDGDSLAVTEGNLLGILLEEGPLTRPEAGAKFGYANWPHDEFGLRSIAEIRSLLFPTRRELVPYVVLFSLRSGLPPECIAALTADCLTSIGAGKARISSTKQRAQGPEADTFSDRSRWSPGQLIRRVIKLTELSRRFAVPDARRQLWLAATANKREQGPEGARFTVSVKNWHREVDLFVVKHGLSDDDGAPLSLDRRRLRKTFFAKLDRTFQGDPHLVSGPNQSAAVAADHYLSATTETETVTATIESTQDDFVRRAKRAQAITVLTEEEVAELMADVMLAARVLKVSPAKARALLHTDDEDVTAAKCKDFEQPPNGPAGEPCNAPVWDCLFCKLALITPSKLPNLLRLQAHIDAQFDAMPLVDWQRRYGPVNEVIRRDILPRFSPTVVAAARERADAAQVLLPPEELIS